MLSRTFSFTEDLVWISIIFSIKVSHAMLYTNYYIIIMTYSLEPHEQTSAVDYKTLCILNQFFELCSILGFSVLECWGSLILSIDH